jgi:competence protein ComFC
MNILDYIFPKRCVGCGRLGRYFCDTCRLSIRKIESNEAICPVCERLSLDGATHPRCRSRYAPDGLTSFFHYKGVIQKAIKSIKYRFVSDAAEEFVSLTPKVDFHNHTLIPIPLHTMRVRERGFNQSEILGKLLAKRLNVAIRTDILQRIKYTVPQVEMNEKQKRLKNMNSVFSGGKISGKIILFDDVFTTGATMRAAAGELKRHGVQFVWAVTMAR